MSHRRSERRRRLSQRALESSESAWFSKIIHPSLDEITSRLLEALEWFAGHEAPAIEHYQPSPLFAEPGCVLDMIEYEALMEASL